MDAPYRAFSKDHRQKSLFKKTQRTKIGVMSIFRDPPDTSIALRRYSSMPLFVRAKTNHAAHVQSRWAKMKKKSEKKSENEMEKKTKETNKHLRTIILYIMSFQSARHRHPFDILAPLSPPLMIYSY